MSTDKRLTLIRHANAEQDADVRDFERPLSKRGLAEAQEVARRFQERGFKPDLILLSAAVRTRENAETFARELGVPARLLQADDSLYLADGEHILSIIRGIGPRVSHLMVIGHNPGISAAAISLALQQWVDAGIVLASEALEQLQDRGTAHRDVKGLFSCASPVQARSLPAAGPIKPAAAR